MLFLKDLTNNYAIKNSCILIKTFYFKQKNLTAFEQKDIFLLQKFSERNSACLFYGLVSVTLFNFLISAL